MKQAEIFLMIVMMTVCIRISAVAQVPLPDKLRIPQNRPDTPAEAWRTAYQDVLSDTRLSVYWRYVWLGGRDLATELDIALNLGMNQTAISVNSRERTYVGIPLAAGGTRRIGNGTVVRVDLRQFVLDNAGLVRLAAAWELMARDEPYFLTNATTTQKIRRISPEYEENGQVWDFRDETRTIRIFGPHVEMPLADIFQAEKKRHPWHLQFYCASDVPLLRVEWLLHKLLANEAGGLYYEFRGIRKANSSEKEAKKTDFDVWLARYGVDLKASTKLGGEQTWATFRSNVTQRSRQVSVVRSPISFPTTNQGLLFFTRDPSINNEDDPEFHAVLNLENMKFSAIEAIAETPWGGWETAVFTGNDSGLDEQFALVRFADPAVVADHSLPSASGTAILEPTISCVRCHGVESAWQPLDPDRSVRQLLTGGLVAIDPKRDGRKFDTRLAQRYHGDLDRLMPRAREDISAAMTVITGDPALTNVRDWWGRLSLAHDRYFFEEVDATTALEELAVEPPKGRGSVAFLNEILLQLPQQDYGLIPEDPRIAALKRGIPINRRDWEAVYVDAAYRAMLKWQEPDNGRENIPDPATGGNDIDGDSGAD